MVTVASFVPKAKVGVKRITKLGEKVVLSPLRVFPEVGPEIIENCPASVPVIVTDGFEKVIRREDVVPSEPVFFNTKVFSTKLPTNTVPKWVLSPVMVVVLLLLIKTPFPLTSKIAS